LKMKAAETSEIILKGISVSPGICIGKAYLVDQNGVDVIQKYTIEDSCVKDEVKRFKAAVKKSKDELRAIIKNTSKDFQMHSTILETQEILLKDKMLYGRTIETIEKEKTNAEWALKKVVSGIKTIFQNMDDPYLKERKTDIVHLSDRITLFFYTRDPDMQQLYKNDVRKGLKQLRDDITAWLEDDFVASIGRNGNRDE